MMLSYGLIRVPAVQVDARLCQCLDGCRRILLNDALLFQIGEERPDYTPPLPLGRVRQLPRPVPLGTESLVDEYLALRLRLAKVPAIDTA